MAQLKIELTRNFTLELNEEEVDYLLGVLQNNPYGDIAERAEAKKVRSDIWHALKLSTVE